MSDYTAGRHEPHELHGLLAQQQHDDEHHNAKQDRRIRASEVHGVVVVAVVAGRSHIETLSHATYINLHVHTSSIAFLPDQP